MHRFIRDCPQSLNQLLDVAGYPGFPQIAEARELLPDEVTTVDPLERHVDSALVVTTEDGRDFVLVGEAQGGRSEDTIAKKRRNWPYYIAYLHEKHKLPVVLVVLCQEKATANWAREPIHVGPEFWPTQTTKPLVLGPHNIPLPRAPITDEQLSAAVFGVIAHGKEEGVGDILGDVAEALENADPVDRDVFASYILYALNPRPTAKIWMELMKTMNVDPELVEWVTSGAVGEIVDGLKAKAEARGEASSILRILDKRGIELTDAQRERILGCIDLETLGRWLDASIDATTADEIFG